jgi:clathrin heavy chain
MEIGQPAPNTPKLKKSADIQIQQEGDFPVLMSDSPKYGVVFIITKFGYLYMYEVSTAALLYRQKFTDQLCVVATKNPKTDGMIVINKAGGIFAINVEENNLVPFITQSGHITDNKNLSFKLAQRFHLPGADEIFMQMFNQKMMSGDYAGAANVAKDAPGTLIRNQETINKIKLLPVGAGGPAPILIYFNTLLQSTKLNAQESIELARPVIQQNKLNLIEQWIKENKLTVTDELGDMIRVANPQLALTIFQQSGSPDKVIQGLIETNQLDKILPYCEQTGHIADWIKILRQILPVNPQAGVNLAKMVTSRESGPPKANIDQIVNVFLEFNKLQELTAFLLEALKSNRPDEGHL